MKFNKILRKCRMKVGINQKAFAEEIGISHFYMNRIEAGLHIRLKLSTIRKMAKVLKVQPAPLIWKAGKTPEEVSKRRQKQADSYFEEHLTGV